MEQTSRSTLFFWSLLVVVTLSLVIMPLSGHRCNAQTEEEVTLTGAWKNDLYIYLNDPDTLIDYSATLDLNYSLTSLTFGSISRFSHTEKQTSVAEQTLELDGRLGIFDFSSDAVFDFDDERLDYWLTEASTVLAGVNIQSTFLLEYLSIAGYDPPFPGRYGAGAELAISSTDDDGVSVDIRNRFGLKESEAEILGVTRGSGYDIDIKEFGPGGDPLSRAAALRSINNFHYVNTLIEVDTILFDCCTLETETKFTGEKGFEYTLFEFPIRMKNFPLTIYTDLKFEPQTKSVTLDPELDIAFDCFTVYMDMVKDESTGSNYSPQVEGFELRQLPIGPIKISSITSLDGNLYRNYGTKHLKLRSYEYLIDPDKPLHYIQTGFDEVFSLEASTPEEEGLPSFDLGVDLYFDMSESDNIFDIALITMNAKNTLTKQIDVGTGVTFDPSDGPTELFFEFDYYF